jgi:hypothetical protein
MKYQKELKKFIGDSVKYDEWGGGYIWGKNKEGDQMLAQVENVEEQIPLEGLKDENEEIMPIISVRGWGAIQHLFKTEEEAIEFQNELGIFIQDAINEKLKTI